MAAAAIFALAVIGTAGAFGYRSLFGSPGSGGPPPVIKADASPSKIVPAAKTKEPQNSKLIYDRVADRVQNEKIVSREEQPVDMNKPAGVVSGQNAPGTAAQAQAVGSGVVGMEPKKVHTIAIYPDQATTGNAPLPAAAMTAPAKQAPPPRAVSNPPPPPAEPSPQRQTVVASAQPARQGNAPLSLNPDAQASVPAKPAPQPMRTASAPPAQAAPLTRSIAAPAAAGGYAVQVSSQRSEAEAQAAFLSLQSKYPTQLGDKTPIIHRVDLGAKGIYFRAMVGPFASANEATELCAALKAAGGSCLIQRN